MSGRKKHRIFVELEFDKNVTVAAAASLVRIHVAEMRHVPHIKSIDVKEAERVVQAELRWRGKDK